MPAHSITERRAIEALRAGVPNRDAVRALGCAQPKIEANFRDQLDLLESGTDGSHVPGILVAGGFGSGKSHLLEYLGHVGLERKFVCSRVVVSKETPFHDPVKLYRSAIESAAVPDRRGAALGEVALRLDMRNKPTKDFYDWVHDHGSGLHARYAATLHLFLHLRGDPEASDRIVRFWSGDDLGVGEIKRYLRSCGGAVSYKIDKIVKRDLALQRFRFASRLMIAAGYSGWIVMIDEVELIGRYSFMQRAKSYAELTRWMGKLEGYKCSGLVTVLAITDDFEEAVLRGKDDLDRIPNRLQAKGLDGLLAAQAEKGMHIIARERQRLDSPEHAMVQQTHDKLRSIYHAAYGWKPPPAEAVERLGTTSIREYIKGWITEWDLIRLYPDYRPKLVSVKLAPTYDEDSTLGVSPEEDTDQQV